MNSIQISPGQLTKLRVAHSNLTTVLTQLGALDNSDPTPEPEWKSIQRRQWGFLNAVAESGGDVGSDELSRIGASNGYDSRGLGGFFRGHEKLMGRQGERRVLTLHGRNFVERHRDDYAKTL
jgi:hypothetical protein